MGECGLMAARAALKTHGSLPVNDAILMAIAAWVAVSEHIVVISHLKSSLTLLLSAAEPHELTN